MSMWGQSSLWAYLLASLITKLHSPWKGGYGGKDGPVGKDSKSGKSGKGSHYVRLGEQMRVYGDSTPTDAKNVMWRHM